MRQSTVISNRFVVNVDNTLFGCIRLLLVLLRREKTIGSGLADDFPASGGRPAAAAMPVNNQRISRAKPKALTAREVEVLTWVAHGKSAWEIGEILNIAKRTVDEHAQTAVRKLGAVNRTHAVALAVRERIVSI
jgi:DNA-binding CsgD family transcriptional regulator